ncbi:MAG: hypothetical protein ACPLF9_08850, partial [Methanothermobacter tenebrarum]
MAGIDVNESEVSFVYSKAKIGEEQIVIALTKDDDALTGGVPLLVWTNSNGWKRFTLKTGTSIEIGTTVDFSDPNWNSLYYKDTVLSNFDFVALTGAFMEQYWHYGGAEYWTRWSCEHNLPFAIHNLFFHYDNIPTNITAAEFITQRVDKVLLTILENRTSSCHFRIVLAGEPYFEYQGQIIWQGQYQPYLLYQQMGQDWIVEAETQLLAKAFNQGLVLNQDFEIIGINLPGIELPGNITDYTISEVVRLKRSVYEKLSDELRGTYAIQTWRDIPFDIGAEFHLEDELGDRNVTLPLSRFDIELINSNVRAIEQETGSRVHITELDGVGKPEDLAYAMAELMSKGNFASITFFEPLKPVTDPRDPWQNILFDNAQRPTLAYYLILKHMIN